MTVPGPLFDAVALVWFTALAIAPRQIILALSFGKSRISDTGVKALRVLAGMFALWSLGSLLGLGL